MLTKRFSKLFIAAVVIVAALLTASFAARFNSASSLHTVDRSYDAVEQVRSEHPAADNAATDRSYDLIESLRVNRAAVVKVDRGYDQIEQLRTDRLLATAAEHPPLDECFDVSLSELTNCRSASQTPAP